MRAIAEGLGSELLVGTTKNALLRGDLTQGFSPVIQVCVGVVLEFGEEEEVLGRVASTALLHHRATQMSSGDSAHIPPRTASLPAAMTGSSACGMGRATRWPGASTSR